MVPEGDAINRWVLEVVLPPEVWLTLSIGLLDLSNVE